MEEKRGGGGDRWRRKERVKERATFCASASPTKFSQSPTFSQSPCSPSPILLSQSPHVLPVPHILPVPPCSRVIAMLPPLVGRIPSNSLWPPGSPSRWGEPSPAPRQGEGLRSLALCRSGELQWIIPGCRGWWWERSAARPRAPRRVWEGEPIPSA